jgi:hypothetical protein
MERKRGRLSQNKIKKTHGGTDDIKINLGTGRGERKEEGGWRRGRDGI